MSGVPGAGQDRLSAWRPVVVEHIAKALLSNNEERHAQARRLAGQLDEVGLNVDLAIDDCIHGFGGRMSPREAWVRPSARREDCPPREPVDLSFPPF